MNSLLAGFLFGALSILVYKSSIIELIRNSTYKQEEGFSLLEINITAAEEDFVRYAGHLVSVFETIGFARICGVKDFDGDELLKWTKWFFHLPLEKKMSIAKKTFNTENSNIYRGYYPVVPGSHSFKEAFEMGIFNQEIDSRKFPHAKDLHNTTHNKDGRLYMRNIVEEKNVFPVSEKEEEDIMFMKVMRKYYKIYNKVGKTLLSLISVGLGFKQSKFHHLYADNHLSTFRLLHYPTRLDDPASIPVNAWDGKFAFVTGEHIDTTVLTILATFDNGGLQIKPPGYSQWIDLPADKDKLVINIGVLLASLVEDRMVATNHRVIDTGTDRYSVPFFYAPHFDADISKTLYGNENDFVGKYGKYGPWMTNRTSQFYEYATTDFGVAD